MAKEKFFWADEIADRIIKERKKKIYVCASGTTPSGTVHIGNFREAITTDLVVRALRDKGKKVRFIYSWDDYDRFRKVPANVPKEYEKYLGMSISDVPSPKGKESYAEHFEKDFEEALERVGIKPEFIRQSLMNKKCKYAELIKKALENLEGIKKILNKYRKEPLAKNWIPLNVYCEKCKKDSTKIISFEGYEIEYECKCGFKDKIDFRKKGIVKLAWRVDWPMRWTYEKVDFEPSGIDHQVYGGSFMTGKQIVKEVFDYVGPMGQIYEWIRIKGGREFSSSKGNATTLNEVEEIYEPEVLRYLFVGTRPNKGFAISFDNDVIKIYEDYDALERKYYEGKVNKQEKRIYELSNLKVKKTQPKRISFRHLITLIQSGEKLKDPRAEKVKNWLEKYAGEDMKFEVQTKVSAKLDKKEKKALIELREILKEKNLTEEKLFNGFYEICKNVDISNKDFFAAAYKVIINKKKGPRLASLILSVGQDKILKLLEKVK
jgi:lysyl-tRNA synthetase class 1